MNPRALLRPIMRSVQTRVDNAVRAAEKRDERRLQVAVGELHEALATEAATQHRLRAELGERLDELNDQLRRISGQLVALEQRVGALERPAVDLGADDAERRTARALVDEVRLEHDRARAGLAAIAFYEERLARLEQAVNSGVS